MPESPRPWAHFASAVEETLRAGADVVALARERGNGAPATTAAARMLEQLLRDGAKRVHGWSLEDAPGLAALRRAVRDEAERWDGRAAGDPAARRVRDLFRALADVLEEGADSNDRQD